FGLWLAVGRRQWLAGAATAAVAFAVLWAATRWIISAFRGEPRVYELARRGDGGLCLRGAVGGYSRDHSRLPGRALRVSPAPVRGLRGLAVRHHARGRAPSAARARAGGHPESAGVRARRA